MAQFLHIHPENPQMRLIKDAIEVLQNGGVIVYPTDAGYALGCQLGDAQALERIRRIKHLDEHHLFTLVCRDLSEIATYAQVGNTAFRLLKAHTPGAYTFLLTATREVPRRLLHPKRKTIGVRVPDNAIVKSLLETFAAPILSTTLQLPDEEYPFIDPDEIYQRLEKVVDLVIDGGVGKLDFTSIIDMQDDHPQVVREGAGDVRDFL
ncbi:MAG: L-threonylcarbamoyladenylate synthase [Pseudomonadota bacterium]|nr:threonylcarbamoyl-AMP synthase [Gammaproteobacteria bacterium]MBU1629149.1 threonylcarbamoyl-AMP synthase [Gammaproteobacteria bacterium]MBU1927163.1 threonylcarbamoyl-AMP synthase [Gammaproteobacteria bacterium]MBU2546225.1 threonylcarbamoyl-AMP synthase [Gammaproteobacteria bacterium]